MDKKADLLNSLKQLWNRNYNREIYGREMARRAREKGLIGLEGPVQGGSFTKHFIGSKNPVISTIAKLLIPDTYMDNKYLEDPKKIKADLDKVFFSIKPTKNLASQYQGNFAHIGKGDKQYATLQRLKKLKKIHFAGGGYTEKDLAKLDKLDDKLHEAKIFSGIGETVRFSDLVKKYGKKNLLAALKKRYGKGFILKKIQGADTIKSRGAKTPGIYFSTDSNISNISKISPRDAKNWILQPDKNLGSAFLGGGSYSGVDEFRVHVVNGKVVPYATRHRGSLFNQLAHQFSPIQTAKVEQAERFAQNQINRLKDKAYRKGNYAFDIAFDNKGKPQLIETNPMNSAGISGFYASSPDIMDSVRASIKGELPKFELAKRIGYGGAALGAGALAYNKLKQRQSTQASPEEERV